MSKIIKMTPQFEEECRRDFEKALSQAKLADGKISFTKTFESKDKRTATIYFTPKAWIKMSSLINEFDKEVAWHGVASRLGDEDKDEYIISDIFVYPQEVTGATVNTNQAEYESWLMGLEDDVFNNLRMQGHSHVKMQTSPSSVDLTHQEKILDQLEDDMFYIFMIWNKSFESNIKIYDLKKNILFETKDVHVTLLADEENLDDFIKDAKTMVVEKKYTSSYSGGYSGGYYQNGQYHSYSEKSASSSTKALPEKKESETKTKTKVGDGYVKPSTTKTHEYSGYNYGGYFGYDDDDDEDIYGAFYSRGR